ncbi:MAG: Xaa-Pro dipeptidase [Thermoleophilaceae bacterium]|jgi:Xaa-Pro aminopeptidase|nr:Xaa-Pro dipeptidase [Thermoleophilaceae bacterium]
MNVAVDTELLIAQRQQAAVRACERLDAAALIGTQYDNVQYITDQRRFFIYGWEPNSLAVITREGASKLLAGGDYFSPGSAWEDDGAALQERDGWNHYTIFNAGMVAEKWAEWARAALAEVGVQNGRVGIDRVSWDVFEAFREAMPDVEFVRAEEELQRQRAVKNAEEQKLMRQSAWVASQALAAGMEAVRPGVTENEIAAAFMGRMYELGSEGNAFSPFLTSGPVREGGMFATNRTIEEGDPVIMDLGPIFGGYHGDCMRTAIAGEPTKDFEELHRVNYEAMYAGIEKMRPGARCSEVDTAVRDVQHHHGYLDTRFDSGHGIGLACLELPILMKAGSAPDRLDMVLEPGMCVAIEPHCHKWLPDGSFIQSALEETVLITDTGYEVITSAPYAI